jgi:transcriptional regulator with XRE-family HTH domain
VKLDTEAVRRRCAARGIPLTRLLREAGISRTAYYSLARKDSVLPKSLIRLAGRLATAPSGILDETAGEERRARTRLVEAKRVRKANPNVAFENVWHTLALLDEPPIDRLNRALRRGRASAV